MVFADGVVPLRRVLLVERNDAEIRYLWSAQRSASSTVCRERDLLRQRAVGQLEQQRHAFEALRQLAELAAASGRTGEAGAQHRHGLVRRVSSRDVDAVRSSARRSTATLKMRVVTMRDDDAAPWRNGLRSL